MSETVAILWMIGLTVSQFLTGLAIHGVHRRWDTYDRRELELDQAERMQRVIDLLAKHRTIQDQAIRRATEALVIALADDPLTREKYWMTIQALRTKLAEP